MSKLQSTIMQACSEIGELQPRQLWLIKVDLYVENLTQDIGLNVPTKHQPQQPIPHKIT